MIRTFIADPDPAVRAVLRDFFQGGENFNIIGEAACGEEALEKILSLDPDLVTLEIEMPKKNGFEVIEEVLKRKNVPIVVITAQDNAKNAYEASVRGAMEFYSKAVFSEKLKPQAGRPIYEALIRITSVKTKGGARVSKPQAQGKSGRREIAAVVIASSTGGPKALVSFFSQIPPDFPAPLAIVQHNSSGFDESFAQWLGTHTSLKVKVAEEGEALKKGTVYVACTDRHLELRGGGGADCRFFYSDGPPQNNQKPAADILFKTAAESLKDALVSVVLTGMGNDGAAGTAKVREAGGVTIAQDEGSSFIYGMPKAALETGCVDIVLPLDKIPGELVRLTKQGSEIDASI